MLFSVADCKICALFSRSSFYVVKFVHLGNKLNYVLKVMDQPQLANPRFFRRPPASSPDASRIWNECCLGDVMEVTDIYWALDNWARLNCQIDMRNGLPYVFWISPSGVRHECFADTFAHWLLCACEEVKEVVSLPPQPLTPVNEIQPSFTLDPIVEEKEATNEIIFHDIQKIDDSADNAIEDNVFIQTLKGEEEPIPLTFEEIVHMNLEQFLTKEEH